MALRGLNVKVASRRGKSAHVPHHAAFRFDWKCCLHQTKFVADARTSTKTTKCLLPLNHAGELHMPTAAALLSKRVGSKSFMEVLLRHAQDVINNNGKKRSALFEEHTAGDSSHPA